MMVFALWEKLAKFNKTRFDYQLYFKTAILDGYGDNLTQIGNPPVLWLGPTSHTSHTMWWGWLQRQLPFLILSRLWFIVFIINTETSSSAADCFSAWINLLHLGFSSGGNYIPENSDNLKNALCSFHHATLYIYAAAKVAWVWVFNYTVFIDLLFLNFLKVVSLFSILLFHFATKYELCQVRWITLEWNRIAQLVISVWWVLSAWQHCHITTEIVSHCHRVTYPDQSPDQL